VESILDSIQLGERVIAALRKDAEMIDAQDERGTEEERKAVEQAITENKTRTNRLLDSYLDNLVDQDTYQRKARELGEERLAFEQRRVRLNETARDSLTARLDRVVGDAGRVRLRFQGAGTEVQRDVLGRVLLNATLRQQEIADYQLKEPFSWLQKDQNGALIHGKWPLLDLNHLRDPT
jgi:hypothetical protein